MRILFIPRLGVDRLASLSHVAEFRSSGKHNVGSRIQGSLAGVLNNADDEANADNLHRDVVRNAEQRASQGNKQQGAASDA